MEEAARGEIETILIGRLLYSEFIIRLTQVTCATSERAMKSNARMIKSLSP